MADSLEFPPDFIFGVATSAYQVEGHIENDWSAWERAGKLKEPHVRAGRAVDHWNRFEEDLRLTQEIAAQAFRISLEWARIEPTRGQFDERAIEQYRHRLQRMKQVGIRPVVTLHHFTHPTWFHDATPWHKPECLDAFRAYARVCARILDGLDAQVVTFNEPMVLLLGGYLQGVIPPGIADGARAMAALSNIARCHVIAREEILARSGRAQLGISQNVLAFAPDRMWHPLDRALTHLAGYNYNHAMLEALTSGKLRLSFPGVASVKVDIPGAKDSCEFVGINYYTRAHLRFVTKRPFVSFNYRDVNKRGLTDIGWEDFAEGFLQLMLEMKRYGLPLWITENGIDDRTGDRRPHYLYAHWKQCLEAIRRGIDLRGYLYWSLLDNFEWLEGWGPRFGLYHVNFETLERTATPACPYFRAVATGRKLIAPGLAKDPAAVPAKLAVGA